jgi:ABC-type multidrug transport system fused ATPase/permease subunit
MLEVLFARDSAWHEGEASGSKIKRISNGADGYNFAIRAWINNVIEICVRFVSIPLILSKFDIKASVIMAFFVVSYFTISHFLSKPALKAAYQASIDEEGVYGVAFESVSNIRSIQVLSLAEGVLEQVKKATQKLLESYKRRVRAFQFRFSFLGGYAEVYRIVAIGFIAYQVVPGAGSVASCFKTNVLASRIWSFWSRVRSLRSVAALSCPPLKFSATFFKSANSILPICLSETFLSTVLIALGSLARIAADSSVKFCFSSFSS